MPDAIPDLSSLRAQFPALQACDPQGRPFVYFDGPGGTQVPQTVIDAMADYFCTANANLGGPFATSRRTDEILQETREAMADFLNAPLPREIVFGANMTTLTFSLSRAIGRTLVPGDEIVVTRLDHDGNISPWLALAEQGVLLRKAEFNPQDGRLDLAHLSELINPRTKLVAVGLASNALGTINPVAEIAKMAHAAGALLWVDAVQYAPHGPIDVQQLDCDFLVCSAYKFFGPHVGILWGRSDLLDDLEAYKVRPAPVAPPGKFETGTLNFEGLAGVRACIEYLAGVGKTYGNGDDPKVTPYAGRRRELKQAAHVIKAYERQLFTPMLETVQQIPGVNVFGITDSADGAERCPTLAFTMDGHSPAAIATHLGNEGIFVWHGNYYALEVTRKLGLESTGGMVRVGLTHYNTAGEVARFLGALEGLAG